MRQSRWITVAVVKATMYRVARKRAVSGHPFDRKTADASNRHHRMRNREPANSARSLYLLTIS